LLPPLEKKETKSKRSYLPAVNFDNASAGSLNASTINPPLFSKPIFKVKLISGPHLRLCYMLVC
jgi:hypothetical protein